MAAAAAAPDTKIEKLCYAVHSSFRSIQPPLNPAPACHCQTTDLMIALSSDGTQEMQYTSSSHSSNSTSEIVDGESHCDGRSNNDHYDVIIMRDNQSKSIWTTPTSNLSREHRLAIVISHGVTPSDENEKMMEGRRGYVFTMAGSSIIWAFALLPYWTFYCSDIVPSISKTWMDVVTVGYIFLIITIIAVASQSSRFKDGKLSDGVEFKLLQIVQAVVLVCLWAGTFIPLRVCRRIPNWLVGTCAAGALLILVLSWAIVFQQKTVIKCIMAPCQMFAKCAKALREMVIRGRKVVYDKVEQWLPDLSLSEYIKAKLMKVPEENSDLDVSMELV